LNEQIKQLKSQNDALMKDNTRLLSKNDDKDLDHAEDKRLKFFEAMLKTVYEYSLEVSLCVSDDG